jgi:hypothetical protein
LAKTWASAACSGARRGYVSGSESTESSTRPFANRYLNSHQILAIASETKQAGSETTLSGRILVFNSLCDSHVQAILGFGVGLASMVRTTRNLSSSLAAILRILSKKRADAVFKNFPAFASICVASKLTAIVVVNRATAP